MTAPLPLAGRAAVVTGGGAGMGRAHCEVLAERGARVFVQDIRADKVEETVAAIRAAGGRAEPMVGDLRDLTQLRAGLAAAGPIDILVNNAGISGRRAALEAVDEATFDLMIATTLRPSFFAIQAVVPGMKQRRYGKIINIASNSAMKGMPFAAHYVAAKGAMLGLTKALALELAPFGICVNAVAPSLIKTEMTIASNGAAWIDAQAATVPMGRLGTPRDVALTVAFLASPDSDFTTGQTFSPNGGDTIVGL